MLITKEQLLTPIKLKSITVDLGDGLEVMLREMSYADIGKLSLWLFPGGESSKKRRQEYRLKQAVLSIVDADGNLVFDFPDTDDGNKAFFEFAGTIGKGGAGHWRKIIEATQDLNGDEEETETLEGKSNNSE